MKGCRHGGVVWTWLVRMGFGLMGAVAGAAELPRLDPYAPDEWTLHLWHLDESRAPFWDSVKGGFHLQGLLNGAEAGQVGLPGMDRCVTFHRDAGGVRGSMDFKGGILLGMPGLADGDADNAPPDFGYAGEDGAFTVEALVKFDLLPWEAGTTAMSVVSMDGEGDHRRFNFRVEKSGFLAFLPLSGGGGALAAIPISGVHAIEVGKWFHVAVSYDGNEGTPNNLALYWTRLDAGEKEAHLIGKGSMVEDLPRSPGDFAIGNEAREEYGIGEAEPFDGCIDEVRISSVARAADEFLMTPVEDRGGRVAREIGPHQAGPPQVKLTGIRIDGDPVSRPLIPHMVLPPGPHRLDFDYELIPLSGQRPIEVLARMKGGDERWRDSVPGMTLIAEVLDEGGRALSVIQFAMSGASRGWRTGLEDSEWAMRHEPIFIPPEGKALRISLTSGTEDTTGLAVIDDLQLMIRGADGGGNSLWSNGSFSEGVRIEDPDGVPEGWQRSGSAPTIGRMVTLGGNTMLALIDGDQAASGSWSRTEVLPELGEEGATLLLKWREMFNVIGGSTRRSTFPNVPSGSYDFEVAAVTTDEAPVGYHLLYPFEIRFPFWSRPWFWGLAVGLIAASVAIGVISDLRRRASRRLSVLKVKNALASDRARIARDMHDDLGTRITRLTMNAALANRDFAREPGEVPRHLGNLSASARELVETMESLVWAIDPANDSLDQLGERLTRMAEEVFQDSEVQYDLEVPLVLPEWPLRAEPRHHLVFAVKESLHNVVRHAGPCQACLSMRLEEGWLKIRIEDDGRGFERTERPSGNGLGNLRHRMESVGGICRIDSSPGKGTRVQLDCPLESLLRDPRNV